MIWEQGSVVIVTLCRLQENGEAVCSRYWPEEASEVYHIYEVHLVSEHIWTDDYLVRSFYLKNLKTGETRTVTQFHFLVSAQFFLQKSFQKFIIRSNYSHGLKIQFQFLQKCFLNSVAK